MDGTLILSSIALAYRDASATSNPEKRYFDWSTRRSYAVSNPTEAPYTVDPGATLTIFNGTRSTSIDNTTQFTLSLSPLDIDRYRFTVSGGTAPAFRTDRALALLGRTVAITAHGNATTSFAAQAGDFNAVQVGDVLFIPGISTGDGAGPFSELNVGAWTVIAKNGTSSQLELSRPANVIFSSITESIIITANSQVTAFSAAGVQVGDKVTISAGFVAPVLGTYTVAAVTPGWFEVVSPKGLPVAATATPTTAGIQFYTGAKRWIRCEGDQSFVVRLNGATDNTQQIDPWFSSDLENTGVYEKAGPTWSMAIVNLSSAPLKLLVQSAE